MNNFTVNKYINVCPRNCCSSCSMISHVENGRLVHVAGDTSHPYTKGKLCSKGFAYIERNYHPKRLKYPYYREKNTEKFVPITWEKAYDLIINHLIKIHEKYKNFLPVALYKYTGNLGVHHYVTDEFFSCIGKKTKIVGAPCVSAAMEAIQYDVGAIKMSEPSYIKNSDLIIIWGGNPANTNIHLIPSIIEAKMKGGKVIVIDPLHTKTADLGDLYIQLRPSTDGALANLMINSLFEMNAIDDVFLTNHSTGFEVFQEHLKKIDKQNLLRTCGVSEEAIDLFLNMLTNAKIVSHLIGLGLQRHSNGGQNIRAIQALAAVHGDIGKNGGGIYFSHFDSRIFNNQQLSSHSFLNEKDRKLNMNKWIDTSIISENQPPIEMLWISCRNPLTQDPNPKAIQKHFNNIPFIVAIDHFMTPTAEMANLVLPTTTHFEEMDIVTSCWHKEIVLNEKAIPPYYESHSEWTIMTELSKRLNQYSPDLCSFPIYTSEEEYLNSQFNDQVSELYGIKSVSDLRKRRGTWKLSKIAWADQQFATSSGKYQFYSPEAEQNGFPPIPIFIEGKSPCKQFPFWLMTPHHPYAINSQFRFLDISEEGEACVEIHPEAAHKLGIFNGEVIKIFNSLDSITIKAIYSSQVPIDILLIYEGWYPNSDLIINRLIPVLETDMGENVSGAKGVAFYDTFVNVAKL